ncbi:Hypothetical Protein FCC1311_085652 [Hondaea fermentalgiana]|uniref:Uncharacterized protein n=1 Tax=Hondaea fermentalgiana TaxID=2315210 RepID=A0A2R5GN77_9STRA|nr:Hypothetical Protein FCC1311_085652 [Hondaea fermentalgiana]|eukprot:GBG32340.1 Hypothetical Protein FCC1311_085652 [Hondaea fermentalgiana]
MEQLHQQELPQAQQQQQQQQQQQEQHQELESAHEGAPADAENDASGVKKMHGFDMDHADADTFAKSRSSSQDSNTIEDARGMEEKGNLPVDVLATDPKDIIDAGPGMSAGQQHELERALKASLSHDS